MTPARRDVRAATPGAIAATFAAPTEPLDELPNLGLSAPPCPFEVAITVGSTVAVFCCGKKCHIGASAYSSDGNRT